MRVNDGKIRPADRHGSGVKNPLSDKVGMNLLGGYLFAGDDQSLGRRGVRHKEYKFNPRIGYRLPVKRQDRHPHGIRNLLWSAEVRGDSIAGPARRTRVRHRGFRRLTKLRRMSYCVIHSMGYVLPTGRSQGLLSGVGFALSSAWPTK